MNLDLIVSDGEKSPFELLGLDVWTVRSLPPRLRTRFLQEYKKVVEKTHHPDLYNEDFEKKTHEAFFKRVGQVVDELLDDEFYLEEALDERPAQRNATIALKRQLDTARKASSSLQSENATLRKKLTEVSEGSLELLGQIQSHTNVLLQHGSIYDKTPVTFSYVHFEDLKDEKGKLKSQFFRFVNKLAKRQGLEYVADHYTITLPTDAVIQGGKLVHGKGEASIIGVMDDTLLYHFFDMTFNKPYNLTFKNTNKTGLMKQFVDSLRDDVKTKAFATVALPQSGLYLTDDPSAKYFFAKRG